MKHRGLMLRATAVAVPAALTALFATAGAQAVSSGHHDASAAAGRAVAASASLSTKVTDKVIIVLRNQFTAIPDSRTDAATRSARVASLQRPILSELASTHARNVKSFSLVNAVAATVSPAEAARLQADPQVKEVIPDLPVKLATLTSPAKPTAKGLKPLPGACAPHGHVQLNPEAILNIHAATQSGKGAAAQSLGYTGAGVKVGFIADGLDVNNPDFIRANGKHVFVDYEDFSGVGTNAPTDGGEAFLDASSIAAQGRHVYNVATYGTKLDETCNIRILGVAPGASLVGMAFVSDFLFNSGLLEAINYAVTRDHVNVLNESFGENPFPDEESLDLIDQANDAAVKAGVTVVVASGDSGVTNTIASPASDPNVISAGATTTYRSYAQTGIAGITTPGVKGWLDNNISGLSSGGFDQTGATVDVVAPGDLNWALCTPKPAMYGACTNFAGKPASVEQTGGTSEASPLTAGTAALVIQAYAQAHHGQVPTPATVKQIIMSTAENIGAPAEQQGAGMIDAYQAVLAARNYPGSTQAPKGNAILDSTTQLNAVGQPGTSEQFSETLTNDGSSSQTIKLTSHTLGAYQSVLTEPLTLTAKSGYNATVKFTVPPGQARLNVADALVGGLNLSLIAPNGDFAFYNLPQGFGDYGDAQVSNPEPGTWTALLNGVPLLTSGNLPTQFEASTATWQPFGTLSASSLTLAPGASGSFTLTVPTPSQPGDESGLIVLHSSAGSPSFAATTSIPVTLRALAPTPNPSTTFTGTLTGGNGRSGSTGQTNYYQFQVPSGLKALNAEVSIANPNNTFFAELVDPTTGEVASTAFNGLVQLNSTGEPEYTFENSAELHVLNPNPGMWTLIIDFFSAVSGTAVSAPFTVTLNDTPVTTSQSGLPSGTVLAAGTPVTAYLNVTNNTNAPEAYFVDARLSTQATVSLAPQVTAYLPLPDFGVAPTWLVPSETSSVSATVTATKPLFFDLGYTFGDPDVMSSTGTTATATLSASQLAGGLWTEAPSLAGAAGRKGFKTVTAHLTMTATTAGFNNDITSSTGDLWLGSTNVNIGYNPYVVNPGQSLSIPVTITPTGTAGSTVSGTIYLDDTSDIPGILGINGLFTNAPVASAVAAFPYSYTVGG
jgi:hypothetical protein